MRYKANLLVVEDDQAIQDMLAYSLEQDNYKLHRVSTVKQAWSVIESNPIDLVLLDWMLPETSGIDLLHRIRKYHANLPVIMITARSDEDERVMGLDMGADDYVTKPFSIKELKSRIRAVLRRNMPDEQPVKLGPLFLDPVSYRAKVNDAPLALSPTEFRLLHYLMSHPERVFTRSHLLDHVWGETVYVEERTVDVHVRRLRRNLEPYGVESFIQTVHGRGYRLSSQE